MLQTISIDLKVEKQEFKIFNHLNKLDTYLIPKNYFKLTIYSIDRCDAGTILFKINKDRLYVYFDGTNFFLNNFILNLY